MKFRHLLMFTAVTFVAAMAVLGLYRLRNPAPFSHAPQAPAMASAFKSPASPPERSFVYIDATGRGEGGRQWKDLPVIRNEGGDPVFKSSTVDAELRLHRLSDGWGLAAYRFGDEAGLYPRPGLIFAEGTPYKLVRVEPDGSRKFFAFRIMAGGKVQEGILK